MVAQVSARRCFQPPERVPASWLRRSWRPLGHVADVLFDSLGLGADVEADHSPLAAGGREDAAEHAEQGRLAGAVGAEEAEDLSARDGEGNLADCDQAAEAPRDLGDLNDWCVFGAVAHRPLLGMKVTKAGTPA
jgi:hypothetical protein